MNQLVYIIVGTALLSGCGAGTSEAENLVEQHRIMIETACEQQGRSKPGLCECVSNALKDNLSPSLLLSAAQAITNEIPPSEWIATLPEDQRTEARAANKISRQCF